ncbi:hypothetical protein ACOJUR_03045 [Alicyclobacillus tolerans]|uniref:hypothetical protein n=1 Tax=Alicyclobacillus tolerans TaxID=90970 RepID=UPI003B7BA6D6
MDTVESRHVTPSIQHAGKPQMSIPEHAGNGIVGQIPTARSFPKEAVWKDSGESVKRTLPVRYDKDLVL